MEEERARLVLASLPVRICFAEALRGLVEAYASVRGAPGLCVDLGAGWYPAPLLLCGRFCSRVVAVDKDGGALRVYARLLGAAGCRVEAVVADLEEGLPESLQSCRLVTALSFLEHLRSPARLLASLSRCMEPGGLLVVVVPRRSRLCVWAERADPTHYTLLEPGEWVALLEAAGFRVLASTRAFEKAVSAIETRCLIRAVRRGGALVEHMRTYGVRAVVSGLLGLAGSLLRRGLLSSPCSTVILAVKPLEEETARSVG